MRKLLIILSLFVLTIPLMGQNYLLRSSSGKIVQFNNAMIYSPDNSIPFLGDLASNYSIRSGSYFIDPIANDTAEILIPEFVGNNIAQLRGDNSRVAERLWDGNDYSLYFRMKQADSVNVTGFLINDIFNTGTTGRRLTLRLFYQHFAVYISDGTTDYTDFIYSNSNGLLDYDYFDVLINIRASSDTFNIKLYDPNGSIIAEDDRDISAFVMSSNANSADFTINSERCVLTNFKKFEGNKTITEVLDYSYITDAQMIVPHVLSGVNVLEDSNHFQRISIVDSLIEYIAFNSYLMDYGYDYYKKDDNIDAFVPYKPDGSVIKINWQAATIPLSGFRLMQNRPASVTGINDMSAKIRFNNPFFNRKNTTIWSDSARSVLSYYDASDSTAFHVSELNQRTLYEWLNVGYKGTSFVDYSINSIERFDRQVFEKLLVYNTDKINNDNLTVLGYTGDDLAVTGNVVDNYYELGYLQSDTAMLVLRVDDTDTTSYTDWKFFFDTVAGGVDPIAGIHSGEMGQQGVFYYTSSWSQVDELVTSYGWELGDHNYTDVDYSNIQYVDSIGYYMELAKQTTLDSIGYSLQHYIPNRRSCENMSTQYYSYKVGYKSMISLGDIDFGCSTPDGTNYKIVDKYDLSAMSADLVGDYNLDLPDNTQELANLKAQIDTAVAGNRFAIIFVHNYAQRVADALSEVINYANDNGVVILKHSEAVNRFKYLPK